MPIQIVGEGLDTRPVLKDSVLPVCNTRVPSKREVLEALATIERLARAKDSCPAAFATLRTYILTR